MITRRAFNRLLLGGAGLALTACEAPQSSSAGQVWTEDLDLLIWWEHGYLPEENEGIIGLVQSWEAATGKRARLKLVPDELIGAELPKIGRDSIEVPDLVFSIGFTTQYAPLLAWNDELLDLSDTVAAHQSRYVPAALSQVRYRNGRTGGRAYYALPIGQSDDFIHFWDSALAPIGLGRQDVPLEWAPFWRFWCEAQDALRRGGRAGPYGLGLCLSPIGFDFYITLMMFLEARGLRVADERGFAPLHDKAQRRGLADVFAEIAGYVERGYVPPASLEWSGSGNNNSFLDGEVLMTHNLTLSIPITQKQERSPYNWDAAEHYRQIVTLDRPLRIEGRPLSSRKSIKQILVPKRAPHAENALDFLGFMLSADNMKSLLRGFKGRILPVMPEHLTDPYWLDAADAHFTAAIRIAQVPSQLPYEVLHPVFSDLQGRGLWGRTLGKIARHELSPLAAVDWLTGQAAAAMKRLDSPV